MTQRQLAALAIGAVALAPERLVRNGPVVCPFRRLTGRPCPACGLTRAWNAAARLKLRDSIGFHPLGLPALAALGALGWQTAGGRPARLPAPIVGVAGLVWLGVWIGRLRSGAG